MESAARESGTQFQHQLSIPSQGAPKLVFWQGRYVTTNQMVEVSK